MVLAKALHGHSSARVKYFHCFGGKPISSMDSHRPDDDNERTMGWESKQPPSSRASAGDRHKRSEKASTNPSTALGRSVIICATFLTSQRCTAVSIDTRNAVAKSRRQFWNCTCPPFLRNPCPSARVWFYSRARVWDNHCRKSVYCLLVGMDWFVDFP